MTTIVDMPYDAAGPVDSLAAFEAKVADVGREAVIDVALWATVPPRGPIDQVQALVDAGAAAFKLSTFETHPQRFPRIPDAQLLAAFAAIAAAGGMAGIHAENDEIVRAGIAAEQAAGHGGDPLAHARSRPEVAEHEAIARVLELARVTGVRIHICHVSTRAAWSWSRRPAPTGSTSAPRPARTTCCSTSPHWPRAAARPRSTRRCGRPAAARRA